MVENAFEAGAEWHAKQSPWISVEERLPEKDGYYIVTDGDIVVVAYFFKRWGKFARYKNYPYTFYENCIKLYMPIPTFDEILEANSFMQWFICTEDCIESPDKEWKVGDWDLNTCPDVTYGQQLPHWRKATVEELINHFK